jgi:hypothetical protein
MSDPFQPEDDNEDHGGDLITPRVMADEDKGGLFVTDRALIRRLGIGLQVGYRALRELDAQKVRAPFPHKDPRFGNRRYWPAVIRWLNLYYGVERPAAPEQMPMSWEDRLGKKPPQKVRGPVENFDARPPRRPRQKWVPPIPLSASALARCNPDDVVSLPAILSSPLNLRIAVQKVMALREAERPSAPICWNGRWLHTPDIERLAKRADFQADKTAE